MSCLVILGSAGRGRQIMLPLDKIRLAVSLFPVMCRWLHSHKFSVFLCFPSLLGILEVGAEMKLSPEELTVLRGEEAQFTCSTSNIQWAVMTWQLNQIPVLTIHNDTGVLPVANPDVSAKESPDSPGDWVFSLKNTERQNQGEVTCNLQDIDRRTASLSVQGLDVEM